MTSPTPKNWFAATLKALREPRNLLVVLWVWAAITLATYEAQVAGASGWLFELGAGWKRYPRPIGWLFVASVSAVILLSAPARLSGPNSFLMRTALVVALVVTLAVPAWIAAKPHTRADCYLKHIKSGMTKEAVSEIRWACRQKFQD